MYTAYDSGLMKNVLYPPIYASISQVAFPVFCPQSFVHALNSVLRLASVNFS